VCKYPHFGDNARHDFVRLCYFIGQQGHLAIAQGTPEGAVVELPCCSPLALIAPPCTGCRDDATAWSSVVGSVHGRLAGRARAPRGFKGGGPGRGGGEVEVGRSGRDARHAPSADVLVER
jgi:hypothetical protein